MDIRTGEQRANGYHNNDATACGERPV